MLLSDTEKEQRERFAGFYQRNQLPVMQRIERSVCGCDFGGTSWTTQEEADAVLGALELKPHQKLLDLGAGSGWPGLYLAAQSGCDLTLVDLPPQGLAIAAQRAAQEKLTGAVGVLVADARVLPFGNSAFDAITHSDLLCCLPGEAAVLAECRRLLRNGGRMIFSVISVSAGLNELEEARAREIGPLFIASEASYPQMLRDTDWKLNHVTDLTEQFSDSARRFLKYDQENKDEFIKLLGEEVWQWRQNKNAGLVEAIGEGLIRRELFDASPQ